MTDLPLGSPPFIVPDSFRFARRSPAHAAAAALFVFCCFTLAILSFWPKAIIPFRFLCGLTALVGLALFSGLRARLLRSPAAWGMALFAFCHLVSGMLNKAPLQAAGTGPAWLCMFLAFWLLGGLFAGQARIPFVCLGLSLLLMLLGCLLLGREGLGLVNISAFQEGGDRLVGLFQSQGNRLAVLLSAAAFLLMSGGFAAASKRRQLLLWGLALVLAFALLNAATRAWVLVLFTACGLYLLCRKVSFKLLLVLSLVLAVLVGVLFIFEASQLQLYLDPAQAGRSLLSRVAMWRVAWQEFLAHPLLGVGPEQFRVAYARYYAEHLAQLSEAARLYAIPSTTHAHNFFLSLLAEVGVVGAASLSLTVFTSMVTGWRTGGLPRDCAVLLMMMMVVGMINPSFAREPGTVFAAVLGLAASGSCFAPRGRG